MLQFIGRRVLDQQVALAGRAPKVKFLVVGLAGSYLFDFEPAVRAPPHLPWGVVRGAGALSRSQTCTAR